MLTSGNGLIKASRLKAGYGFHGNRRARVRMADSFFTYFESIPKGRQANIMIVAPGLEKDKQPAATTRGSIPTGRALSSVSDKFLWCVKNGFPLRQRVGQKMAEV